MTSDIKTYGMTYTAFAVVLSVCFTVAISGAANAKERVTYNDDNPRLTGGVSPDSRIVRNDSPPKIEQRAYDEWKKKAEAHLKKPTAFIENDRYVSIKSIVRANNHLPEAAIVKIIAEQFGYTLETAALVTKRAMSAPGTEPSIRVKTPPERQPYEIPRPMREYSHGGTNGGIISNTISEEPAVDTSSAEPDGTAWKEIDIAVVYDDTPLVRDQNQIAIEQERDTDYYDRIKETGAISYKFKDIPYEQPVEPRFPTWETE